MIQAERRAFAKALEFAGGVAQRRSTIPVLSAVKVSANGRLRVEGSDLDTSICAEIDYEGDGHEGFSLREPARVRSAINHAGGDAITLEVDEGVAKVGCALLNAAIGTLPGDDHPGFERVGEESFAVELGAAELAAVARVRPAISTEETRYYLNGVCIRRIGDWLYRFAATDGHRLMIHDVPLPGATGELPHDIIVPRSFIDVVLQRFGKTKKPVRLTHGRRVSSNAPDKDLAPGAMGPMRMMVRGEVGKIDLAIATALIDGTYPDYHRVIPSSSRHSLEIDRAALVRAIHSLQSLGEGKVRALKFAARKGGLTIRVDNGEVGKAKYDIEARHDLPLDFEVGFNGQYFLDCCEALTGEILRLELTDPGAPSVIRDPADTAFFSVLMPMRV